MTSKLKLTFIDYNNEKSGAAFDLADVNAGNFTTQDTAMDTLRDAVEGVSIASLEKEERVYEVAETGNALPVSAFAQRETKWLVSLQDDVTGKRYTREIPGADLALLTANTNSMDVSAGAGATLVTAIEANVLSEVGNAVSVTGITHVGRNI